jgi:hypothetical protein
VSLFPPASRVDHSTFASVVRTPLSNHPVTSAPLPSTLHPPTQAEEAVLRAKLPAELQRQSPVSIGVVVDEQANATPTPPPPNKPTPETLNPEP